MKELRLQSGQPGADFRLAVAVDGANAMWGNSTIKKEDKSFVRKTHWLSHHSSCLSSCSFFRCKSHVSHFLTVIRWIQESSLWFITWGSSWRTTGWEEQMCGQAVVWEYYFSEMFTVTFSLLPQTGGAVIATLAQTGSIHTSKSAYLPQELLGQVRSHFHSALLSAALKPWQHHFQRGKYLSNFLLDMSNIMDRYIPGKEFLVTFALKALVSIQVLPLH